MTGTQTLQGWKEIAAWLGRDERTAKRWEKQRGLPVRRTPGSGRANVFCLVPELEAWLVSSKPLSELTPPAAVTPPPAVTPDRSPAPGTALPPEPEPKSSLDLPYKISSQPSSPHPLLPPAPVPHSSLLAPAQHPRRLQRTRLAIPLAAALLPALGLLPLRSLVRSRTAAPAAHAPSPVARDLALQAAYLMEQRTPASLTQARANYEAALRLDPAFAEAHAGLAHTFLLLREYAGMPQTDAYLRAEQAANRALALNPDLADAHTALGFIDFFFHWQPSSAEQQFRTAIALNPQSAIAHHWFGSMLLHQARYDAAIAELNHARVLQPGSPAILATTVLALGLGGHRQVALTLAGDTLRYQPDTACMHRALATLSLAEPRDIPTYLAELRRFATLSNDAATLTLLDAGDPAFRSGGEPALWQAMLHRDRERASSSQPSTLRASLEAASGDTTAALDDLTLLAARRDPGMIGIAIDPLLQNLRSSGRLRAVASRMNLTLASDRLLLARSEGVPSLH